MPALEGGQAVLRRHGDLMERLPGGLYAALGRCDDTMNLGGIKVCLIKQAQSLIGISIDPFNSVIGARLLIII